MTTYTTINENTDLKLGEVELYGSSRLGSMQINKNISDLNIGTTKIHTLGEKLYEISNHLGNVLSTVSDKKEVEDESNGLVDQYIADLQSSTDYFPFGSPLPNRGFDGGSYRFGFNGKEQDNEVTGADGVTYDYGFRIYDARLGRFLSIDPLFKSYPWYTPYQFAGNKPVWAIDLDGCEEKLINADGSHTIRAVYSVITSGPNAVNIEISVLQSSLNAIFNSNSNYNDNQTIDITLSESNIESNDNSGMEPFSANITVDQKVQFQITVVDGSDGVVDLTNPTESRIFKDNGMIPLGGTISMGTAREDGFISRDKDNNPITDASGNLQYNVPGYYDGTNIILNPEYFDADCPTYHGFAGGTTDAYNTIAHEIGHDLNLEHPKGEYPPIGTMSAIGSGSMVPTDDELDTIDDSANPKVSQP